jgi:hypothetical protein
MKANNLVPVYTIKGCRGSRSTAPLILNLGTRGDEAGWVLEMVWLLWRSKKSVVPAGYENWITHPIVTSRY